MMNINLHQIRFFVAHFFTAKRKGHGVHSPFAYRLCEEVFYNQHTFSVFGELNGIRKQLLENTTLLQIEDHGAGSKTMAGKNRRVCDIAAAGISTTRQSELLFRLCNFLNCSTVIELGTALGLNALYLSAVSTNLRVISIEGSEQLARFAQQLAINNKRQNLEIIHGLFDEKLSEIIQNTGPSFLLYIDGNHTREATLRYFEMAVTKAGLDAVIVFDDIYWSPGMTEAWKNIRKHPRVKMSLDLFHSGIIFFRDEIREPVHLKLFV